ncbi:Nitrogen fixation protein RnfC [Anaerohalosphaera lusitana]|uniref:Ion-translocating oxidoreductase complex subunit C n=1 Tax=Anaerohalosphaera lusitana TaxID=1936003 RepID=A0A1U9NHH2_9BACT|nr:Nitrogen fixation protein RnfC [Anaerohalosphaera lusitana]
MIGTTDAFVSSPVHSPVNGTVKDIALRSHPVLGRTEAIVIDTDEENPGIKTPVADRFDASFDENKFTAQQIGDAIKNAGIVGMGGAGFPTRVKVEPDTEPKKHTMLINACECEPYITCDYRVMLEWTYQFIAGIKLAKKISGCKRVCIGVEDNKTEALQVLKEAIEKASPDFELIPLQTKYPQGGEKQLIKAVLDQDVPLGGIPPQIGLLVMNVATCAAIAEAVVLDQPLTHRALTVTGHGINSPGNFYVPIGTPIQEIIDLCGGLKDSAVKVILGGPMMGFAVGDLSTPVTKTCGSILVLSKDEISKAKFERKQTPCIRCGRCLEVCPANINPTKIAHSVKHNMLDLAEQYHMAACIECGCCSYICPANIEITGHIKTGKVLKARQQKKMPK